MIVHIRRVKDALERWWWLGVIPIGVVLAMTLLTYRKPATVYQVVLHFTVGGAPAQTISADYDRYYAWLASEYVANGLADLAVTGAFAQAVSDRLAADGMDIPSGAIQSAIVTDNAQSVMILYLSWPDAEQAGSIASAVGETLVELGPTYYPQMGGIGPVAQLADPPTPTPLAPSLRTQLLGPAVRVLIATAIGTGLIFVASIIDPVIRRTGDLADCGVAVVGTVPREAHDSPGELRRINWRPDR